ncbi:MAG: phosphatidate cytidylyltransferase [Chitinophagales bacterium]|mgnify:CR=1 FL=1|jgi:phosphatidate cytidylyltransferase|nr:phosphatidate cytidylyltransferase [Chitinophagales bacterium]HNI43850.1 phosphatidate cytidylyltransferase [Chitinophagales bacterium]
MNTLLQRSITAVFFVAVMLLGIYAHQYSMLLLFGVVCVGGIWEYQTLVQNFNFHKHPKPQNDHYWQALLGTTIYFVLSMVLLQWLAVWYLAILLPLPYLLLVKELFDAASPNPFARAAIHLLGWIYVAIPLALLNYLAIDTNGLFAPNRIVGILLLIWANDAVAYLAGSKIGSSPLFKRVSPKKTWEGTISGIIGTMIVASALCFVMPQSFTVMQWYGIAILVACFSTIGDLIESVLKRNVGVKDSGNLLPGHGGILDRFDALLFVIPFIWVFVFLTTK